MFLLLSARPTLTRHALLAAISSLLLLPACRNHSDDEPKTVTARGVATKIDLQTREVAMNITLERTGEQTEVKGNIAPEAEVFVNGVKREIADIRVGDEIAVECLRVGEGDDRRYVVQRVEVTRPQGWKTTTTQSDVEAPASPPRQEALAAPENPDVQVQRETLTNDIYAEIRRRMEEALAARAALLDAGRPADDPEILKHEGVIRRARHFLMDRGENLPPVEPPLSDKSSAS
jgi:hypothetical protein